VSSSAERILPTLLPSYEIVKMTITGTALPHEERSILESMVTPPWLQTSLSDAAIADMTSNSPLENKNFTPAVD